LLVREGQECQGQPIEDAILHCGFEIYR